MRESILTEFVSRETTIRHYLDEYRSWIPSSYARIIAADPRSKWLEETGRAEVLPSKRDWQVGDGHQQPGTTLKYSEQEFQEMVANALDEVPEEFDKEWNNVAVIVSTDWPTDADKKKTSSVATKTVEYMRVSTGKDWYLTFNLHHVQSAAELTAFRW